MNKKAIPCPCKQDCPNRTTSCKLECVKYNTYEKLKRYEEKKKQVIENYKERHYVSEDDIFAEWLKETKIGGRNASNYLAR